jgi:RNA polymerase sigma-70 factor (ECF subfamily)
MVCEPPDRAVWIARNVLPHEPLIRDQLTRICGYDLDIEDVIQEMYARLLNVPTVESIQYPKQYALQTARAIIIDQIRHSHVVSITLSGSLETLDVPEPEANAEERLEFRSEVLAVAEALKQLPNVCRQTLMLRRLEGLPQKQVAQRLGISEKMVEKHMMRGVKLLYALFGRGGKVRERSSHNRAAINGKNVHTKPGN